VREGDFTAICEPIFLDIMGSSTPHNPMGLHGLLRHGFNSLHIDDVRTLQKTHLWASATCYGDSLTFLYVGDVRTSQETSWLLLGLLRE
jgi:hypothetical protein